ncbi:MAG: lysylphosphatidylglycerol synthase transmembrane domain-containing protein [Bacteroidota bacterium]|jgi:uncharacterized protein (TIRG00374 family)|nr:lysylphosphatidylglycerol synthase transmembrane domain-containing protein [Bacteroidota bacterium]
MRPYTLDRIPGWRFLRRWRHHDAWRIGVWIGKLLLALLVLGMLAASVQGTEVLAVLADAQLGMLAVALLLLPLNIGLQYAKWRVLVHSRCPSATAGELRASLLLGFTFGIITPARLGEFGGRAAAIRGADRFTLVGLTAVDKFATMSVTILAGMLGLFVFTARHPVLNPPPYAIPAFVILALVSVGAAVLYLKRRHGADRSHPRVSRRTSRLRHRLGEMRDALRSLDAVQRRRLFLLSLFFYLTFLVQFYFLLLAFGPVDAISAIAGIGTIMLLKTVAPPVTLGELGIREGVSVYVLGHAGILAAAAFNASLLLFAINILLPSLAGVAILLRMPRKSGASREQSPFPGSGAAPVQAGSGEAHA